MYVEPIEEIFISAQNSLLRDSIRNGLECSQRL